MNTAIFELFGKLTSSAYGQAGANVHASAIPILSVLPTEEDCLRLARAKPLLFFYEPLPMPGHASEVRAATDSTWLCELTAAKLSAALSLHSLRVTEAEDDAAAILPSMEVWPAWPRTIGGWQLCVMSHLCAVLRSSPSLSSPSTSSDVVLLSTRYELIGTAVVLERFLLLSCAFKKSKVLHALLDSANSAAAAVNVAELRTFPRLSCLCRCFCAKPREVATPRPTVSASAMLRRELTPPSPPVDFLLRLAPASLPHTFCLTTTPLVCVAESQRCRGWAMALAQRAQTRNMSQVDRNGGRPQLCSAEAANTSGALTDGEHTTYHDSLLSHERSTSTVRVLEGAMSTAANEDHRSATSTPARPPFRTSGRREESHSHASSPFPRRHQQQQPLRSREEEEEAELRARARESALERRLPPSQRWSGLSLLHLMDRAYYDAHVPAGWRRWRYASSGILCRPLVVDSLDGIVRYIHGSRAAFYAAVAFLDKFIASTVDPVANLHTYRAQIQRAHTGQEMDFSMMTCVTPRGCGRGWTEMIPEGTFSDGVHARDICGFLTQVIVVCIMLGSKTVDLYPPRIRQLMGCVEDTAPIGEQEFVILELHVLLSLGFPVNPITLVESVGALLTFCTSDALHRTLTASHTIRRLLEEHQDRGHLVDDVDRLVEEQLEKDAATSIHTNAGKVPGGYATSPSNSDPDASAVLSSTERMHVNAWLRLRLFATFICDEVIRADASESDGEADSTSTRSSSVRGGHSTSSHDAPIHRREEEEDEEGGQHVSSRGWTGAVNVLQFSPVLVAAAALVTAAEQLGLPLPEPLLRLVPAPLRRRLRVADVAHSVIASSLAAAEAARGDGRSALNAVISLNEESNGFSFGCGAAAAMPVLHRENSGVESEERYATVRLTAKPCDDHYHVLEELCAMLENELLRLCSAQDAHSSPRSYSPSPIARRIPEEDEAVRDVDDDDRDVHSRSPAAAAEERLAGDGRAGTGVRHCSVPRPADAAAVSLFGRILTQVKGIHERNRESCPPVLLQRYQPLFREAV